MASRSSHDVHVTDPLISDLLGLYQRASSRLELVVMDGLRRGLDPLRAGTPDAKVGDATLAYRNRAAAQAHLIINELEVAGAKAAPIVTRAAYHAGLVAVDRSVTGANFAGRFGAGHAHAASILAANMSDSLAASAATARDSVDTVFARANELAGPLPTRGALADAGFIGRRVDDPYRSAALEQLGQGMVAGDTRRQITTGLVDRLINEGTTDALTGFVTKTGGRIPLHQYASMVARTTTREAMSRGTVNRLNQGGLDLGTISSHGGSCPVCLEYDGNTYSLGDTPVDGYDSLDELPPFHPNCGHVLTPADANLDAFEAELDAAIGDPPDVVERDLAAADHPEPHPPTPPRPDASTPEGKIANMIDEEHAIAARNNLATNLEGRVLAQTGGKTTNPGTPTGKILDAVRNGTEADLDPDLARMLEAAKADLIDRVTISYGDASKAERLIALQADELDEAAVGRIGAKVRALVDRRTKAAEAKANRRLAAAQTEHGDNITALMRGTAKDAGTSPEEVKALTDRVVESQARRNAAREELNGARRKATVDALGKIRPGYGKGALNVIPENAGKVTKAATEKVRDATKLLPKEWIDDANASGKVYVKGSNRERAHHIGGRKGAGPFDSQIVTSPTDASTALHELGHRLQQFRGISAIERAWFRRRTTGHGNSLAYELRKLSAITGNRGYDAWEVAIEDRFTNAYIGKVYGPDHDPREVLTMLLEGVLYGRHKVLTDRDAVNLILGILAAV